MEHIGIDLGSKESQICVRWADGEIIGEWRCRTDRLVAFLQGRPVARVILETCTALGSRRWHSAPAMTCESWQRRWCGRSAWGIAG